MEYTQFIYGAVAIVCAALIAFTMTPPVRVLAYKIGAIDVPLDNRRMHKKPTPRIGGLAIFAGFVVATLIFCPLTNSLIAIWFGGLILVVLGILDDVYRLPAIVKLIFQIAVAVVAISQNVVISHINFFGTYIIFGMWEIPITILWIVGLTNAINLIDGLDGLACGVSAICSTSLFVVILMTGDMSSALITGILAGACLGFLPFNANPAKIFMGDTGALFLGYTMAVMSVQGVFKLHAVIAFVIPLSIFALPILDTTIAFMRRIIHGKSPFSPDRGHLHHKLVDLGFTQKQTVRIFYAICGILGMSAIVFTDTMWVRCNDDDIYERYIKAALVLIVALLVFFLNFLVLKKRETRIQSGLFEPHEADLHTEHEIDCLSENKVEEQNSEDKKIDDKIDKNE